MDNQQIADDDEPGFLSSSLAGALLSARKRNDGRHRVYTGEIQGTRRKKFSLVAWGGITALLLGALRGRAFISWTNPAEDDAPMFRMVPADEVQLIPIPAAQMLGRLKNGVKERYSKKKTAACRRNGKMPCRPGKRRGRPRNHDKIF